MNGCSDKIGPGTGAPRRNLFRWARRALFVAAATTLVVLSTADLAQAQSFRQGVSAFNRQDYARASLIFIPLAEQGDSLAQYSLGLLYDKGQGVPRDIVEANKWLNLSTAGAPRRAREARARIRDAVTTKMTRGEITRARLRALEWAPTRER